jgi:hypothetical protein
MDMDMDLEDRGERECGLGFVPPVYFLGSFTCHCAGF